MRCGRFPSRLDAKCNSKAPERACDGDSDGEEEESNAGEEIGGGKALNQY